jgi:HEAT repeat protein
LVLAVPAQTVFSAAKDPVAAPLKALKLKDETKRAKAAGALGRLAPKAKAAIPALIETLKDDSEWVQEMASEALQEFGRDAMPFFVKALTHPNGCVRLQVMKLLSPSEKSKVQDKAILRKAVPLLLRALKNKDPAIRKEAVWLLSQSGDKKTIPAIIGLMKSDTLGEVREVAVKSLQEFGPEAKAALPDLRQIVKRKRNDDLAASVLDILGSIGPPSVPLLIEIITSADSDMRYNAVWKLGCMGAGAKPAVPHLVKALDDRNDTVRKGVITALGFIGPDAKPAIPALKRLLRDPVPDVRILAGLSLHEIDPKRLEGIVVITTILRKDKEKRSFAVSALGAFGPKAQSAVPALLRATRHKELQESAIGTLKEIGPAAEQATIAALAEHLLDPDLELRATTLTNLKNLGPRAKNAVPALVNALKDNNEEMRKKAAKALAAVGPGAKAALKALTNSLKDQSVWVRLEAAYALTQIDSNNREGIKVLLTEVESGEKWNSRGHAIELLGGAGARAKIAVPNLIQVLSTMPIGFDPDQEGWLNDARFRAISVLKQLGSAARQAIPACLAALYAEDCFIRDEAAKALQKIGFNPSKEMVTTLIKLLKKKDNTKQRILAAEILEKIGPAAMKAVPALTEALDDRDYCVRFAARKAWKAIQGKQSHARIPGPSAGEEAW